jgi:hypothetical protein
MFSFAFESPLLGVALYSALNPNRRDSFSRSAHLMFFGFGTSFPFVIRMLTCPVEVTEAVIGGS